MLSAQSKYALRLLLFLAEAKDDQFVPVDFLAEQTAIPRPYLAKLVKLLAERGFVITKKGAGGGVRAIDREKEFTFWEVCKALGDPLVEDECVLFKSQCNKEQPCPFHHEWSDTKEQFKDFLMTSICEKQF